jgi:hypothetical protein
MTLSLHYDLLRMYAKAVTNIVMTKRRIVIDNAIVLDIDAG